LALSMVIPSGKMGNCNCGMALEIEKIDEIFYFW